MFVPRRLLRRPGLQWLLFFLGLALVHWPFLIFDQPWPQPRAFYYLFAAWAVIIVLLMGMARGFRRSLPKADEPPDKRDQA